MLFLYKTLGKLPKTLYHYTSCEALKHIFKPGQDGISLRLSDITTMNDPSEQRYMLDQLHIDGNEAMDEDKIFILSLSQRKNDLMMWRMYAKNAEGVSIGFRTFDTFLTAFPEKAIVCPCCYGDKMINKIGPALESFNGNYLSKLSCVFKHPCYKYEKEYRFLTRHGESDDKAHSFISIPKSAVSEIWLGPQCPLTEDDVYGIVGANIRIIKSELPYR